MDRITLGISRCLLGERVRYDGGHKLDPFLRDVLGHWVDYLPVCPEVECGFGVPREPLHLTGSSRHPRMVNARSHRDLTEQMSRWARKRVAELKREDLSGFIFESRSPSCGVARVKVYGRRGAPARIGIGFFARVFLEHFPGLPVEEEDRIKDPYVRAIFLERVFILKRWRQTRGRGLSREGLLEFHRRHELAILARSPDQGLIMEELLGRAKKMPVENLFRDYEKLLRETFSNPAGNPPHPSPLPRFRGRGEG